MEPHSVQNRGFKHSSLVGRATLVALDRARVISLQAHGNGAAIARYNKFHAAFPLEYLARLQVRIGRELEEYPFGGCLCSVLTECWFLKNYVPMLDALFRMTREYVTSNDVTYQQRRLFHAAFRTFPRSASLIRLSRLNPWHENCDELFDYILSLLSPELRGSILRFLNGYMAANRPG
ncbi:hypothetical protein GMRT_10714 [Giardia muris]|uniref:Uncharacterized protein n=1 Tax=Giardia muris TaxID=5742 RepID=A0A4Z1ST83_GIAMU|nr:hypothetical protein GMRT_10714 [Giardia muris]|eukprot:TNJ28960.1 hypothetical protein GMRT_10714 [Giardia muris]